MIIPRRLTRLSGKELISLKREVDIQIALLRYDIGLFMYLDHPANSFDKELEQLNDFLKYRPIVSAELKKRGF